MTEKVHENDSDYYELPTDEEIASARHRINMSAAAAERERLIRREVYRAGGPRTLAERQEAQRKHEAGLAASRAEKKRREDDERASRERWAAMPFWRKAVGVAGYLLAGAGVIVAAAGGLFVLVTLMATLTILAFDALGAIFKGALGTAEWITGRER